MQFLTKTNIPFLKHRKVLIWLSIVAIILSFVEFVFLDGLNFGIDFKGGTQLTVKMRDDVDAGKLRDALSSAAVPIREAQIQRFGDAESHEFLIRVPLPEGQPESADAKKQQEEGRGKDIIAALDQTFNKERSSEIDLNQRGSNEFSQLLFAADPDQKSVNADEKQAYYDKLGAAIIEKRKEVKLFASWDQVAASEGLTPAALAVLKDQAAIGTFQVIQNESVGSQIGSELRRKGLWAVLFSLLAMLGYMWYRFELRFGIGALMASFHDLVVTLGLFAFMNYEFNLATIAAFLTLVGYSVNDTVVVFDRVRENMRRYRRLSLEENMNVSVNETLPRTIMTSGTTLLACAALFFFGGDVLKGFSFVMLIGVIVGTYSSVFIASPFALWWDERMSTKVQKVTQKPTNV